mgnify:CR=1 FL=1
MDELKWYKDPIKLGCIAAMFWTISLIAGLASFVLKLNGM